jgi:hypothetical protein
VGLMRSVLFTKQKYEGRKWIGERGTSWRTQRVLPQGIHSSMSYE